MTKTWFVTGASRGIGAEIARAALKHGDNVVATGRDASRVAAAFETDTSRLLVLSLDVTRPDEVVDAVSSAMARFGAIDVLVNNAGYGQLGLFEEISPEAIERQFATNVFGLMTVTRAVLPGMSQKRSGRIFNLSSVGGLTSSAGGSIYCSSKFAIEGFSEGLAAEVAPFGIGVTLVEPGYIRTDFLDETSVRFGDGAIADYAETSAALQSAFASYSHRQPGDPKRLAAAILELAGRDDAPLRFAAGSDAVEMIAAHMSEHKRELDAWSSLSLSTDGAFSSELAADA
ncbi:oxidoreductase [Amorphus orientalis]|uniref:NAD(P)-dependent dehydrogenase (Short-subunit alcohol dehydrogenase family) n=1 Tax=Amorphus orientalis TaxID=649198 RepID=A0AAE3VTR8_9HYPH|nr:oxidoreductase [Amorphus orientalis]MDQ0317466.1 NAD(P)-dependent dehydrogenase (short-subunit alcohol dehydrogenase family) [Amorphus orientalis]